MTKTFVLNANVKWDKNILKKGTKISEDHAGFRDLKPYLVASEDDMSPVSTTKIVRQVDTKKIIEKNTPADDTNETSTADQEPKNSNTTGDDQSNPVTQDNGLTKNEIIAKLEEKGVEFNSRSLKGDLQALLDANS